LEIAITTPLGAAFAPFAERRAEPRALGFDPDRLARIGRWMRSYVAAGRLPYAMTLIAREGEIAYLDSCGHPDPQAMGGTVPDQPPAPDHPARIYSMTKPIVTVAALTFYEEGRFQLDEPISRILPEFEATRVHVAGGGAGMETAALESPITVRQLMTHTAGLTYGFFDPGPVGDAYRAQGVDFGRREVSLAEMAARAAAVPLCFQPGTRWRYSIATDVLGRLVEVVAGKPLGAVLAERVLDPLGMAGTGFDLTPERAALLPACYEKTEAGGMRRVDGRSDSRWLGRPVMQSGGGGLISTLPDYLRFTEMLRRGGALGGARVLGRKTVELMMSNHLPGDIASISQPTFSEMPMTGIGFGLGGSVLLDPARAQILGSPGEFAWGGVASTGFWIDRKEAISVVHLTQLMPSSSWPIRRELRVLTYQALVD
jgi:CubicO group peptidase (beta-lactamase class C family)